MEKTLRTLNMNNRVEEEKIVATSAGKKFNLLLNKFTLTVPFLNPLSIKCPCAHLFFSEFRSIKICVFEDVLGGLLV